jgi:hypothetical protein
MRELRIRRAPQTGISWQKPLQSETPGERRVAASLNNDTDLDKVRMGATVTERLLKLFFKSDWNGWSRMVVAGMISYLSSTMMGA